jgi:hypothetical protein
MKANILDAGKVITEVNFNDISTEQYRVYIFANGEVKITEPLFLYVSKSGGHRLVDKAGFSHYIPTGWLHLYWLPKEGSPAFVK